MALTALSRPAKTRWEDFVVVVHPPQQAVEVDPTLVYASRAAQRDDPYELTMPRTIELPVSGVKLNNQSVVLCNLITFDFQDIAYDRLIESLPKTVEANFSTGIPNVLQVFGLANSWLRSLREVTGLAVVTELDPTRETWVLEYLHDDGSALAVDPDRFRKRQSMMRDLPVGAVFEQAIDAAKEILHARVKAPWDQLMLKAVDELPATGPAIVLAFAAFEQLVNSVIAKSVPPSYSSKQRKQIVSNRVSSPVERSDRTLFTLVGRSLREHPDSWDAVQELVSHRTKYLHYGIEPTFATAPAWFAAGQLIRRVSEAMLWLEDFLPADDRRDRAVKGVTASYDLPHPSSPVFGALGGLALYLPNDPQPTIVSR